MWALCCSLLFTQLIKGMKKIHYLSFVGLLILVETKKPNDKQQQAVWRLECELGVITDVECPVDGGWTPWSPWSACAGSCDEVGRRRRGRACDNPPPSRDGRPCSGSDHQLEPCYITNCTIHDYRKLVKGNAVRSNALRLLEAVPILLECCLMDCTFEAIEGALMIDNTWQFNAESLWNALQCVKHNLGCHVVGEWGSWGKWSTCGARCGYGLRWRRRKCDTPPPSNSHLFCSGTPLQVDECKGDQCTIPRRDSGGNWSNWGQWSPCSVNCGIGIRRRVRVCLETSTPIHLFGSWGTHCRGQHYQLEVCESKDCKLDGGWSGWAAWGPCSQSCGGGRRSRTRSCTRPEPAGSGAFCSGPRIEVGSCHLKPCKTFSHSVAVFNSESFLQYDFKNKRSTFFHFYVRFLPLSPHGILVRRGDMQNPLVRLSLEKWHVCLDAGGMSPSCTMSRLCSRNVVEPAMWHSILVTVTSGGTTMRIDDELEPLKFTFTCDPDLPNDKVNIIVGERLHGEIQELILNFIPLCLRTDRKGTEKSGNCPQSGSNIAYEHAGAEEAYLTLDNDYYLRLPCSADQDNWQIKLTMKSQTETGTVIFMQGQNSHTWLVLYLQNMRMKLKLADKESRTESISLSDYPPNQWLDIVLSKNQGTGAIEASINAHERLHVLFEDIPNINGQLYINDYKTNSIDHNKSSLLLCCDEYFVGGVPKEVKTSIQNEDFTPLSGVVASVTVNNVLLDLNDFSKECSKDDNVQVSSRTASVSGSYYETAWGQSKRLNLTCLHAYSSRSPNSAHWLLLDSTMSGSHSDKPVRSLDNGKVLRLVTTASNDVRGFYTCRAHRDKRQKNIVTYGVLGQVDHKLSGPDLTTTIAVFTTLSLVLGTLVCLFIEGIHDIRDGYGFFRDAHFSPEEEAEVVCDFIDQNMHLMTSKHAAEVAKARARRIARDSDSVIEKPDNLMIKDIISTEESTPAEAMPVLPGVKSSVDKTTHEAFRCVQSFVSSPRHGSISSPKTKLTTSSSIELQSPRLLCSRLFLGKHLHVSRGSLFSKNKKSRLPRKAKPELLTIKSSGYMTQPLAHKILQRFEELKSDDNNI